MTKHNPRLARIFFSTHVERNAPPVLIRTRRLCAQHRFRPTLADRIVFPMCSNLCSLYAHICSRSTPVDPNAFSTCSNVLSHEARRSKCVSHVLKCALARRLSIQMRFLCAQMRSRSTPVYPNAFLMCSNVLSLDACRSKCVSGVLKCDPARRLSIQMSFQYVQMRSRSTPVDPNAFREC